MVSVSTSAVNGLAEMEARIFRDSDERMAQLCQRKCGELRAKIKMEIVQRAEQYKYFAASMRQSALQALQTIQAMLKNDKFLPDKIKNKVTQAYDRNLLIDDVDAYFTDDGTP